MNKREIREYAAAHGMEAHYRGNDSEDEPKGFRFTPVLLNNLKDLEINQQARFRTNRDNEKLRAELELTIERIEEAKVLKAEFEQSKVYLTEKEKYETSTV